MPQVGSIKLGSEIGKSTHDRYIWHACEMCGKERYVRLDRGKPKNRQCAVCGHKTRASKQRGEANPSWKGGRHHTANGYIEVQLQPEDEFYPMTNYRGRVLEHRLIMAKHLGRLLEPWEIVHHKNRVKDDNVLSNLELVESITLHVDKHSRGNTQSRLIQQLLKEVNRLRSENSRLRKLNKGG